MKFACLVYMEDHRDVPDAECAAFGASIVESGHMFGGEALHPIDTATTIRVRNGERIITDGPFIETKEQLAGFYLINAESHEEALEIASRIPPARVGTIEVRQVRELQP